MALLRSLQVQARVFFAAAGLLLATQGGCRLQTTGSQPAVQTAAPAALLDSSLGVLDSRAALARGPLVLIFYRGHW